MPAIQIAALIAALSTPTNDTTRFHEIQLETGVRMHYAEQGPATRTPMILLHGYSDSWFSYSLVLSALSRDTRVYALDLRGHGNSDRPTSGYRMRDMAADVIAFMDAKQIVRATIVGHSMGGFVAQQVALAAPKRVAQLVLMATAARPRAFNGLDEFEKAVSSLTDPVPEAFAREFQLSTIKGGVSEQFVDRAVSESLKLPVHVWRGVMDGMLDYERAIALGRSGIPTLVLHGADDPYVPSAEANTLAAMTKAREIRKYPDTGHALHWERPTDVARDILAFVEQSRRAAP
jgi:non-heme chloroperoxidase